MKRSSKFLSRLINIIVFIFIFWLGIKFSHLLSLPFSNPWHVLGPLTVLKYNPANNVIRFLFIISLPSVVVLIFALSKYLFGSGFFYTTPLPPSRGERVFFGFASSPSGSHSPFFTGNFCKLKDSLASLFRPLSRIRIRRVGFNPPIKKIGFWFASVVKLLLNFCDSISNLNKNATSLTSPEFLDKGRTSTHASLSINSASEAKKQNNLGEQEPEGLEANPLEQIQIPTSLRSSGQALPYGLLRMTVGILRGAGGCIKIPQILFYVLIISFIVFIAGNFYPHHNNVTELDYFHEGETLGTAIDYINNKVPYADTIFVHGVFQDPLRSVLAFKIFGHSIAALRTVDSILNIITLLLFSTFLYLLFEKNIYYFAFSFFLLLFFWIARPVCIGFNITNRDITLYLFLICAVFLRNIMLTPLSEKNNAVNINIDTHELKLKTHLVLFFLSFISVLSFAYSSKFSLSAQKPITS